MQDRGGLSACEGIKEVWTSSVGLDGGKKINYLHGTEISDFFPQHVAHTGYEKLADCLD